MYGNIVLDIERSVFESIIESYESERGVSEDPALDAEDWRAITKLFKGEIRARKGASFPQAPREQLGGAIGAVFGSWMNKRARTYRRLDVIPESWGTAVNV